MFTSWCKLAKANNLQLAARFIPATDPVSCLVSEYQALVFTHHIGNISGYSNTTDVNSCSLEHCLHAAVYVRI